MLGWPWKRFERFFEVAQQRVLIEQLQERKENMIAALWSNSNYDSQKEGEEAPRTKFIESIEENYAMVIDKIRSGKSLVDEEKESERPPDDPFGFFAAGRRAEQKTYKVLEEQTNGTVQEVIDKDARQLDQN